MRALFRLCPKHRDNLGWDACDRGFDDCEVSEARADMLHRWNRAAADCGLAGSEWFNEPERVFRHIRDERDRRFKAIKNRSRMESAAPDLLAACKAAQEELRLLREKDTAVVYDPTIRAKLSIAIAKAEGENHGS